MTDNKDFPQVVLTDKKLCEDSYDNVELTTEEYLKSLSPFEIKQIYITGLYRCKDDKNLTYKDIEQIAIKKDENEINYIPKILDLVKEGYKYDSFTLDNIHKNCSMTYEEKYKFVIDYLYKFKFLYENKKIYNIDEFIREMLYDSIEYIDKFYHYMDYYPDEDYMVEYLKDWISSGDEEYFEEEYKD